MKKINKYLIFSFLVAFIILLITSKNSFLYPFNDWVDANSFFTVGKSMFNGLVLYKDIFEQKGPLLYLIYGIGYLISHKTFYGVFVLEVISFTIFLYYVHKIFIMFFDKRYSLVLIPSLAVVITTSSLFVQGGSCEEFCLPFIGISLYYYIKHFKEKELTNKEIFINGLIAGLVLMTKYTLLGFWIGFCLFIGINLIYKKEYKKLIIYGLVFLLGMLIPFLVGVIYFLINGALKDFIDVYFIFNITAYGSNENYGLIEKILHVFKYCYELLIELKPLGLLMILPLVLAFITKEKNRLFRLSLVGLAYITFFFIAFGLKAYIYYHLPVFVLAIILNESFMVGIFKKYTDKIINKKIFIILLIIYYIGLGLLTYRYANYKEYIFMKKEDFVQYKYAKYINKKKNATMLNMGYLDIGVYTMTGIVPNTRFFEVHNITYDKFKDNLDEMEKYVRNKKIDFIVYAAYDEVDPPRYIYDNYKLVYKDIYYFESHKYTGYLFELK